MNRTRTLLSGLFTVLSLAAVPAFAAPKIQAQAKIQVNIGAAQPTYVAQPRYNISSFRYTRYNDKFFTDFQSKSGWKSSYNGDYVDKYGRVHSYDQRLAEEVLDLVNQVRAREGLPLLRNDSVATVAARRSSMEASREGSFAYMSTNVRERLTDLGVRSGSEMGEVTKMILAGKKADVAARQIVQSWLKNTSQRRVLLDEDLSDVGIIAYSVNGKTAITLSAYGEKHWGNWQQGNKWQHNDWQNNNWQNNHHDCD